MQGLQEKIEGITGGIMGKIFDLNFYLDEVQRLCAEGMDVVEAVEKVKELKKDIEGGEAVEESRNT